MVLRLRSTIISTNRVTTNLTSRQFFFLVKKTKNKLHLALLAESYPLFSWMSTIVKQAFVGIFVAKRWVITRQYFEYGLM